jgi:hypothetical protein
VASRTLTLALAADIDNLKKGLDDAEKVVNKSADNIADFGKKAAKLEKPSSSSEAEDEIESGLKKAEKK